MSYPIPQGAALILLAWFTTSAVQASTDFPARLTLENHQLERVGIGAVRYAGLIHVYDAALYAPSDQRSADILDAGIPKRLEIVYHRALDAERMAEAAQRTLERQHGMAMMERWQPHIDRLHAAYRDVARGDRFALAMSPARGLWLEFNGQEVVHIEDVEFGRLYFGIWLGDPPLSASLRDALLPVQCYAAD